MFAIIESGAVTRYPADPYSDNPGVSFGEGWAGGAVNGVEYVAVQATPQPAYDAQTQDCAEGTPTLVNGVWTQTWSVSEASAEDKAARLEAWRAGAVVSPFQARAALAGAGLLASAEAAVAQGDETTRLAWQYAQEFRRTSPTLAALATALGLSDAQLDQLFVAAATITA